MSGFIISAYLSERRPSVSVVRLEQHPADIRRGEKPVLWAIRENGFCLNKDGEWEYEPQPSSRDDEFFDRCRFATLDEAFTKANMAIDVLEKEYQAREILRRAAIASLEGET